MTGRVFVWDFLERVLLFKEPSLIKGRERPEEIFASALYAGPVCPSPAKAASLRVST